MSRRSRPPKTASVDLHKVERLATLSRLSLSQQEAERLRSELSSILEYFAALDKVDASGVVLGPQAAHEGGDLRDDLARPSMPEKILDGVPRRKGRYVRAPRVF